MNQKILITFAGAVGTSKTPIACYLSWKFNIPILNNDAIRTEVLEDLNFFDDAEYIKRRNERIHEILQSNNSIIYDASIDREWKNRKDVILNSGRKIFIISLDLSRDFLSGLYKIKGYHESLARIDQLISDHEFFLKNYKDLVNVSIKDNDFKERLRISYNALKKWLSPI